MAPKRPVDDLLTIEDLAAMLHVKVDSIYYWRHQGKGPRGIRPAGGKVLFRRSDVEAWLESQADPVAATRTGTAA